MAQRPIISVHSGLFAVASGFNPTKRSVIAVFNLLPHLQALPPKFLHDVSGLASTILHLQDPAPEKSVAYLCVWLHQKYTFRPPIMSRDIV